MRVNNWISFGCIMAAIAIGVAIALMLSDIATVKAGWCDARPACFRDWVGALSGWAAAFAAGATMLFLRSESQKRDILAWREVVNSALLLKGSLEPQVNHLGGGIRSSQQPKATNWLIPCLKKIVAAIMDPDNQEYRRSSVIMGARIRSCLLLIEHFLIIAQVQQNKGGALTDEAVSFLKITHGELAGLLGEIDRVAASALAPNKYRGV